MKEFQTLIGTVKSWRRTGTFATLAIWRFQTLIGTVKRPLGQKGEGR